MSKEFLKSLQVGDTYYIPTKDERIEIIRCILPHRTKYTVLIKRQHLKATFPMNESTQAYVDIAWSKARYEQFDFTTFIKV
jgi:hypothetical protein